MIHGYVTLINDNKKFSETQKQDKLFEFGKKLGSNIIQLISPNALEKFKKIPS